MSDTPPDGGPAAILAGLIVGDRNAVDFDDPATIAALGSIRDDVVLPALNAHRARLVEAAADVDILVRSGSAADAVSCALAIQNGMAARNGARAAMDRYHFRFGIDLEDGRGPDATQAAAIAALCDPDDVWMCGAVEAQVRARGGPAAMDCGTRPVGFDGQSLQLYRLSPERRDGAAPHAAASVPPEAPVPPSRTDVRQGAILNGTYQIESLIAQGGMGEVFKGHEIHSGGLVAVKLLRSDMSSNKLALGLFQKEALILKDIYHDAIVRYFMFSFDPSLQRHYLAMEFVDGVSLAELLKQGPLPFEAVSTLRQRIASALFVAHERGIIHRDISPDNVIIPGQNVARAKVIDFGIARAAEIGGGTLIGGGFAGKYNYVSPEQLGLAGGEITPQSDIYSLGLVLAESSLGKPLDMNGTQAEVIEKRRQVPDLDGVDPRLRTLIEQMLQPDPRARPASMAAVAEWPVPGALPTAKSAPPAGGRAVDVDQGTGQTGQPRPHNRSRWAIAGVLAAATLIACGIAGREIWSTRLARVGPQAPHDVSVGPGGLSPPPAEMHVKNEAPVSGNSGADTGSAPGIPAAPAPDAGPAPAPVTPAPAPAATGTGPDAMAAYVKSYAASPCFLVKPVQFTPTSALVEAFGPSRDDFTTFDRAFTTKFGFSPDVAGYRVWTRQCPALQFVRQLVSGGTNSLYLLLKSMRVGSGQPISGEIRNVGDRAVTLLLVQEDGTVRNVSDKLRASGDAQTFDLSNEARTTAVPQLLIAIASQRPLASLPGGGPIGAEQLMPAILNEASAQGLTLSVDTKLFLLGG